MNQKNFNNLYGHLNQLIDFNTFEIEDTLHSRILPNQNINVWVEYIIDDKDAFINALIENTNIKNVTVDNSDKIINILQDHAILNHGLSHFDGIELESDGIELASYDF